MGGGGYDKRLAMSRDQREYQDEMDQQLENDVQFGSGSPRLPIPYRPIPGDVRPIPYRQHDFDPKDVPILPAPSGQQHFDPRYSATDLHMLAQSSPALDALRRLFLS